MFILYIDGCSNMLTYAGELRFYLIGYISLYLLAYIFEEYSLHFMAYLHLLIFWSWKVITVESYELHGKWDQMNRKKKENKI